MARRYGATANSANAGKHSIDALPGGAGVMQQGQQEEQPGNNDADSLENTQRAGVETFNVLQIQSAGHGHNAGKEGEQIKQTGGQQTGYQGHSDLSCQIDNSYVRRRLGKRPPTGNLHSADHA